MTTKTHNRVFTYKKAPSKKQQAILNLESSLKTLRDCINGCVDTEVIRQSQNMIRRLERKLHTVH